ncbi:MAG: PilZ domain-containing protein [bacterium]|nr:PilZ domain-containing protein [bacterium]
MKERRQFERLRIDSSVISDGSKIIKPVDVSLGGIQVLLQHSMQVGQITDMQFFLPYNPHKFVAKSVVVWQKNSDSGFFTGLRFERIHTVLQEE